MLTVGGGRELPRLLFATDEARLALNIGPKASEELLDGIRASGHAVVSILPGTFADAVAEVRQRIQAEAPQGIVILGGYDIVPPEVEDCLQAPHRAFLENDASPGALFPQIQHDPDCFRSGATMATATPTARAPSRFP